MFVLISTAFKFLTFIFIYCFYYIFLTLRYIIKNQYLKFPFLLFIINIFYNADITLLYILYFFYLLHKSAIKRDIYKKIYDLISIPFIKLKSLFNSYKLNREIKIKSYILNNLFLDFDEHIFLIPQLILTSKGLYNINVIESKTFHKLTSRELTLLEKLFNSYESPIPITNLITYKDQEFTDSDFSNYKTVFISEKSIGNFINFDNKNINLDINEINSFLSENKAWLPEIIFLKICYFFKENIYLFFFFILFPISYYIYIIFLINIFDFICFFFSSLF